MLSCSGRTEVHNLNLNHRLDILPLPCLTPTHHVPAGSPRGPQFPPQECLLKNTQPMSMDRMPLPGEYTV